MRVSLFALITVARVGLAFFKHVHCQVAIVLDPSVINTWTVKTDLGLARLVQEHVARLAAKGHRAPHVLAAVLAENGQLEKGANQHVARAFSLCLLFHFASVFGVFIADAILYEKLNAQVGRVAHCAGGTRAVSTLFARYSKSALIPVVRENRTPVVLSILLLVK